MDYQILKGRVSDTFKWGFSARNKNTNESCFECDEEEKEWIEKWSGDFKDMVEEAVEEYGAKVVDVEFQDFWNGTEDVYYCNVTYDREF